MFWQTFGLHECASEPFRTFSLAFPASSGFTTFWHQKVVPKASARRNRREPTVVLFPAFSQGGVRGALSRNRDY
jgi:hypothetical protein